MQGNKEGGKFLYVLGPKIDICLIPNPLTINFLIISLIKLNLWKKKICVKSSASALVGLQAYL